MKKMCFNVSWNGPNRYKKIRVNTLRIKHNQFTAFYFPSRNERRRRRRTSLIFFPSDSLAFCPSGIQRRPSADLRRPSPTVGGPAPARLRALAAADASRPLTGARGAGGTRSWTSPSMRRSTPQEERLATSWTRRSGRGEAGVQPFCFHLD